MLNTYFSRNIDGIILYLIYDETRAVQSLLEQEERRVPVVIVGRRINVDSFSNVATDNYLAGVMAGEYLGSIGHKRVATVTGPRITQWARDRLDGFRDGLAKYQAQLEWQYSQTDLPDFETGLAACDALMADYAGRALPDGDLGAERHHSRGGAQKASQIRATACRRISLSSAWTISSSAPW